ncbi:MAG: hypothetical protein RLZZ354_620 [Pseudomonadota bacterium]|jgi:hypothetical protein
MSKSTRIDSRLISLNSSNAYLKNNSTFLSDVIFRLPGLLKKESDIKHVQYQIVDAQIPVSFYNVNYTNNVLNYQIVSVNYSITADPGNYSFTSLATNLIAKFLANGHIFTITINKNNGIVTFSTIATNFIFQVSSMFTVLGLLATKNSTSFNLVCDYPFSVLGVTKIKIVSQFFNSYNIDSANNGLSNNLALIPVDQPSFGLIVYENKSNSKYTLRTDTLDEIDLQLYDQNNNLINFNNIDWQLTILMEITREVEQQSQTEMADILKEQNKILGDLINQQNQPVAEQQEVEQPINPIQTDDLDFFLYSNPNLLL